MSLINNIDVSLNATININQGGPSDGTCHNSMRFMANVGGFMLRLIPLFVLSILGISGPNTRGKS